jgi:Methyltransferase domain
MTSALDKYAAGESKTIKGWLSRIDAEILRTILTAQNDGGLSGSVAEIGVHHGRGFVLLCLGLLQGDKAYCIDIFDDQQLNKDLSGRGDRAILESNLQRFGIALEQVRVDPRSSALVQPSDVMSQVGPIRLFSIDGGHWLDIVASDLALAEQVLAEYGVIALDDFHRAEWPEVSAGYFKWFAGRKRPIVPFAIGFKQLYLCQSDRVDFYQAVLARNDFLTKLKAKTCDFQGIALPVYHRLVRPGESSLTDLLRTYLRVFHPDTFVAAKALLMRVRSLRDGGRTKGSDVS